MRSVQVTASQQHAASAFATCARSATRLVHSGDARSSRFTAGERHLSASAADRTRGGSIGNARAAASWPAATIGGRHAQTVAAANGRRPAGPPAADGGHRRRPSGCSVGDRERVWTVRTCGCSSGGQVAAFSCTSTDISPLSGSGAGGGAAVLVCSLCSLHGCTGRLRCCEPRVGAGMDPNHLCMR